MDSELRKRIQSQSMTHTCFSRPLAPMTLWYSAQKSASDSAMTGYKKGRKKNPTIYCPYCRVPFRSNTAVGSTYILPNSDGVLAYFASIFINIFAHTG